MPDHKTAALFLSMADKDLDALVRMVQHGGFAEEVFGLHAQQAVEKLLKAWLCHTTVERVPHIHDLDELAALLIEQGETIPEDILPLLELSDFAVQFRYEPYPSFDEPVDRKNILSLLQQLVVFVRGRCCS